MRDYESVESRKAIASRKQPVSVLRRGVLSPTRPGRRQLRADIVDFTDLGVDGGRSQQPGGVLTRPAFPPS